MSRKHFVKQEGGHKVRV